MKKESIVLTLLVLTILYSASVFVLNPTVEAQPTEPTLIGRTDVFGHSYQRYTFCANGRFWVFYSDNTNLVYVTSVDGSTWNSATAMRAASSNPEFSVWFDGTNVHYAKGQKDQVPNTPLYYRMGVPNANGNITWNALEQIVAPAVANRSYRAPQIITDSDGYPVITYLNKTTFPSANAVSVSKSSTKNGTWTNAAGFPAAVSTDAAWPFSVPLKSSKLYTMWSIDNGKIRGSLYNGAFWGSAADCSSNYIGEDSRGLSAVSYGDDVHLAYIGNETATKIYRHVKRTYGSGWGPETIVKNATGASENRGSISLTVDSNNGNLWMWFNTTDNKIASRKYTALTSSWETDDAYPFGDLFTFPYYITTSYQVRNNKILAYWQEGTTMPYDLVFSYFAVDTIQPNISILSPIDKTYAVADVPLTFTVSESTSWIGYSLDGQANVTITGNTVLADLSDGSHSLTVYASDTAGNMVASGTFSFSIDTTAPTITITSPENKSYVTPNIPLTFTIDESVSWVAYSLDGQANATISGNITLTALSDGSHSLIVYARDIAGHTGVSETILFTVSIPQEPFPNWAIATIAAIVIVVAALLIYFTKVRKTTEKAPATDEESN